MSLQAIRIGRPIFLVGIMCSGKSTLGKALAEHLNIDFVDVDEFIESHSARKIKQIFAEEGEAEFRRIENACLHDILNMYSDKPAVIALGGGTPCQPGVMEQLNSVGLTVHLEAPVCRIVERLLLEPDNRPLIKDMPASELNGFITKMINERERFYSKSAVSFDSSKLEDTAQVAESVNRFISEILT